MRAYNCFSCNRVTASALWYVQTSLQGLGKMVMLRAKLGAAAGAVKNFFTGGKSEQDPAVAAMEALRVSAA
jgi:hypothetical protein